jgi:hypothetical protein
VLFLVAIFFLKTTSEFENGANQKLKTEGLAYGNAVIEDLVNRDSDSDGLLDWEEQLWGTDPSQKETTPGIPDSEAVNKLRGEQATDGESISTQMEENLTETDKFSRELFSTVATLSQNGTIDETTVEKISSSLAERLQNSVPRKVYTWADIKIINDNTVVAIQKYKDTLISIYQKYPAKTQVEDTLEKFVGDGTNINENALKELDPSIEQMQKIVDDWVKTAVPIQLAQQHLDTINGMERLIENVSDIQLYDNDPILAMGAVKNYQNNIPLLQSALDARANAINQKINY